MNTSNFKLSNENFNPILSLYLFTLSTGVLGFSIYLFLESLSLVEIKIISWSGQGLFWGLITLLLGLFIGFLPIEFFKAFSININSFKDLLATIVYSIVISLFFLILFQFIIPKNNIVLTEIKNISNAVSFSGFIAVPSVLFLSNYFVERFLFLDRFRFSIVFLIWSISIQLFL